MSKSGSRIVLNSAGIQEMLKNPGVMGALEEAAGEIAQEAGNAEIETGYYPERARVFVRQSATSQDMDENTLLKAVHFQ